MKGYHRQAKRLRAMAHPARLQLMEMLRKQPACVCELVAATHRRQPYISQQLSVLRQAGLVEWEKQGLIVRYRLAGPEVSRFIDELRGIMLNPEEESRDQSPDELLVRPRA